MSGSKCYLARRVDATNTAVRGPHRRSAYSTIQSRRLTASHNHPDHRGKRCHSVGEGPSSHETNPFCGGFSKCPNYSRAPFNLARRRFGSLMRLRRSSARFRFFRLTSWFHESHATISFSMARFSKRSMRMRRSRPRCRCEEPGRSLRL